MYIKQGTNVETNFGMVALTIRRGRFTFRAQSACHGAPPPKSPLCGGIGGGGLARQETGLFLDRIHQALIASPSHKSVPPLPLPLAALLRLEDGNMRTGHEEGSSCNLLPSHPYAHAGHMTLCPSLQRHVGEKCICGGMWTSTSTLK
jgi:hypothetical protein